MKPQSFEAEKFVNDTKVNQTDISRDMATNADILGYYGHQEALWKSTVDRFKLEIDTLSASLEVEIKASGEKITDATTKARVAIDPDLINLKKNLIRATEQQRLFANAVSAIENKGHMLVGIGNNLRAEMSNLGMGISAPNPSPRTADRKRELKDLASNLG